MTRRLDADLLDDAQAALGEGPSWDARTGELSWVDILAGSVHVCGPDGRRRATYDVGAHVGAALPAQEGGWLLATTAGFAHLRRDGSVRQLLGVISDQPELRFNDAKCDPWGQALAGTMRYDETPGAAALYRLETRGGLSPHVLLVGLGLSNGLGWSPDGRRLYFIDSLTGSIAGYRYEPDLRRLDDPELVTTIGAGEGMPDGMCVDDEGCLWVALHGGGVVRRYRPDGVLDAEVRLPVPRPTSVAFGGPHRDLLFVTTAGGRTAAERRAHGAGGLWVVDPGVTGPPATPWVAPPALPVGPERRSEVHDG